MSQNTSFSLTTQQIREMFPKVETSENPILYHIGWDEETRGGLIPIGTIQKRNDVPSRSSAGTDAFAANDALGEMYGVESVTSVGYYRSRDLVNKEIAEKLEIGVELKGMQIYVKDATEPFYDGQSPYVGRNGEDRLHNGNHIYTQTQLKKENSDEDSVLQLDPPQRNENNQSTQSEETQEKSEFTFATKKQEA